MSNSLGLITFESNLAIQARVRAGVGLDTHGSEDTVYHQLTNRRGSVKREETKWYTLTSRIQVEVTTQKASTCIFIAVENLKSLSLGRSAMSLWKEGPTFQRLCLPSSPGTAVKVDVGLQLLVWGVEVSA
jgi:hypothetical protein